MDFLFDFLFAEVIVSFLLFLHILEEEEKKTDHAMHEQHRGKKADDELGVFYGPQKSSRHTSRDTTPLHSTSNTQAQPPRVPPISHTETKPIPQQLKMALH